MLGPWRSTCMRLCLHLSGLFGATPAKGQDPQRDGLLEADSSYFLPLLFFMHELAKAVLALALATAAAVWLMGVALHLWPSADQLAYGNPLPYLKVSFNRTVKAVKFWVEDFGGLPYERVWLYVNGQLAASGGPGTNATAKCGDEVAAVVKYHSGTKKLEGRILCTKPIKPPEGADNPHFAIRTALAAQDVAGNVDVTGLPIDIRGTCKIDTNPAYFAVYITPRAPDVLICDKSSCSPSKTYTLTAPYNHVDERYVMYIGPIDVLKTAGAPLARYAGGSHLWLNLTVYGLDRTNSFHVLLNGTDLVRCTWVRVMEEGTWTEFREAPASALYQLYLQWPDGKNVKASIAIYDRGNSFGFRVISSTTKQSPPPAGVEIPTRYGPVKTTFDLVVGVQSLDLASRFLDWLYSHPDAKTDFIEALRNTGVVEQNVPIISEKRTGTVLVLQQVVIRHDRTLLIKVPSSFPLGAVLANTVLPINVTRPPENAVKLSGEVGYIFSRRS